jgi:alkylation response protein AidB-like acyl-CoA dehydrogenase
MEEVMDFKFNEDQQMIYDLVNEFAQKHVVDRIDEIEEKRTVPKDLYDKMIDAGLGGIIFPEEYGGSGLDYTCMVIAFEQMAKYCVSANVPLSATILFMESMLLFGTEAQKKKYIPEGIDGEWRSSFAFTEPGTGSDPKQIMTTYKKEGDHFVLNGVKRFITNAGYEGPICVFAKDANTGEVTGFLFEKFCDGYSISTPWETVGFRGSPVYDVFLDDVVVKDDPENIFGGFGNGFQTLLGTVAYSKMGLVAMTLGTLAASYDAAVRYANEKLHRGKPIAKFQAIQLKIAQIAAIYESCRLMVYELGAQANDRSNLERFISNVGLVKAHVSDAVVQGNLLAMQVLGPYGVCAEYKVERYLRDSLIGPIVEGVSDIQRVLAARNILG